MTNIWPPTPIPPNTIMNNRWVDLLFLELSEVYGGAFLQKYLTTGYFCKNVPS